MHAIFFYVALMWICIYPKNYKQSQLRQMKYALVWPIGSVFPPLWGHSDGLSTANAAFSTAKHSKKKKKEFLK